MVRHGVSHIAEDRQRRGLVLNFTLAENLALREYNTPKMSRRGWLLIGRMRDRAKALHQGVRRPRRRPDVAGDVAVGRQPAEGASSRARSRATRACWSPRSRPAASTSARSSSSTAAWSPSATPGRAILLVSLEFEEVRSLADRILVIYEGRDRRRVPARRVRGGARHRDDRRWAPAGGGRVSPDPVEPPAGRRSPARAAPRPRPPPPPRGWRRTCRAAASSSRCSRRCSPSSSAAWSSSSPATTRSRPTRRSSTAPG